LKKKILLLINSTRASGAEISLVSLLQRLDREKYELYLGLPDGELYETLTSCDHLSVVRFHLKRFTVKKGLSGWVSPLFQLVATAIRISLFVHKKRIDIVYANSTQAMIYCLPVRMLTFKKVIWHARDTLTNKVAASILSRGAARVICVSRFIYDRLPLTKAKKAIVYNGIDTDTWKPSSDRTNFLKADLGLGDHAVLVGHVGQLIPWKNHTDLIRVAERVVPYFKNVHFAIIGDDLFGENAEYILQLQRDIRARGMEQHIHFIGYRKDIKKYMSCLDIVLHTAVNEPFGRVIIESMALEKPVVAYNCGGPGEIIAHQVTGLLAEQNVEALASCLLTLVKDAERRRTFGKAGRQKVKQKFSLEAHTSSIESILDALK
jgi:glycosyltransferase involved in cell wall biosynthesis